MDSPIFSVLVGGGGILPNGVLFQRGLGALNLNVLFSCTPKGQDLENKLRKPTEASLQRKAWNSAQRKFAQDPNSFSANQDVFFWFPLVWVLALSLGAGGEPTQPTN